MMACIFKRGKTWSYSVDIGKDITGKRRKKSKGGFRTQAEAKKAAAIIEAEVAQAIFIDEKNITFAAHAAKWLEIYKGNVKISTYDLRKNHCTILNNYIGQRYLHEITANYYQKLLAMLAEQGYAPKTLNDIHHTAALVFKNACQNKILKLNPTENAIMPRIDQGLYNPAAKAALPKYLEKDELMLFLETAKRETDFGTYAVFTLLAYTGMRIGELMGLQWTDVDFINNEIHVNRTVYIKNNVKEYLLLTPKTRSSKRTISFTDNINQLLRKLSAQQLELRMLQRKVWHDGNFIFTSPTYPGYPLPKQTIQQRMKRILQQAKLNTNITPHSLRHTHASLLAEAGASLEAIMERLGHINDDITRRIYLHITKNTKQEAAQKFRSLLSNM